MLWRAMLQAGMVRSQGPGLPMSLRERPFGEPIPAFQCLPNVLSSAYSSGL